MYIGGIKGENEQAYVQSVDHVNGHFDQHIATVTEGNFDSMDDIPPSQPRRRFPYLATSYIMSSEAARTLVKLVDERGFVVPTQYVLMKLLDLVPGCYTTYPFLVSNEHRSMSQSNDASSIDSIASTLSESKVVVSESGLF